MKALLRRFKRLWKLSGQDDLTDYPLFVSSKNDQPYIHPYKSRVAEEGAVVAPDRSSIINNLGLKIDDLLK